MDQLAADQEEQLKKCSTDRLRLKFVQTGGSKEVASLMDKSQLLDALTKVMLKQTEHSADKEVQNKTEQSALTEIRLKELALENQRMKIEADTRKAEMELR